MLKVNYSGKLLKPYVEQKRNIRMIHGTEKIVFLLMQYNYYNLIINSYLISFEHY